MSRVESSIKAGEAERDAQAARYRRLTSLIEGLRGEHTIAMLKQAMASGPLAIDEKVLSSDHPGLAASIGNLATL